MGLAVLAFLALALYVARELVEPPPPPRLDGVDAAPDAGQDEPRAADRADDVEVLGLEPRRPSALQNATPKPVDGDATVNSNPYSLDAPVTPSDVPPPISTASKSTSSRGGGILRSAPPGRRAPGGPARLAIVIDDLGRSLEEVESLAAIGVALTYAVLPFETRTAAVVARLRELNVEMICHLPMEPSSGLDPGPGALRASMSPSELALATHQALAAVPGAVGVNNHMGSGLSTVRPAMAAVLGVVANRGLYYLDSRTTADTVAYTVAREMGLAAGERQVFLDTDRNPAAIRVQFQRLLDLARTRGGAIGIAHPYPETLALLQAELPRLRGHGFEIVPASELLDPPG